MNTETQEVTGAVTTANVLKMAINLLESLKTGKENFTQSNIHIVCSMCEEAIAQPAQEPVAWIKDWADGSKELVFPNYDNSYPVYTHPAPSWQGLSDDERDKIYFKTFDMWSSQVDIDYAEAIEQALMEKNT